MNPTRQDAWTNDEDLMLAETVLRYIREGRTQLEAFKDVAHQLSRTSAACGFRWNATIRKQYEEAIQHAKKEGKRGGSNPYINFSNPSIIHEKDTLETAIKMLEKMRITYAEQGDLSKMEQEKVLKHLEEENSKLKEKLSLYEQAWNEMGNLWSWVKEKEEV